LSVAAGLAIIGLSAVTDYEGGLLGRMIPMRGHLATDAILGIVLLAAPWVLGFADEGTNAWLPFVVIGLGELGAAALTETVPEERTSRRRQAQRT
jgi:hypothetical protein